jgi:hypothetical protein
LRWWSINWSINGMPGSTSMGTIFNRLSLLFCPEQSQNEFHLNNPHRLTALTAFNCKVSIH